MPDSQGKFNVKDMIDALKPSELRIARFSPPSANPGTSQSPNSPPPVPNFASIQEEIANYTSQELATALFDFIGRYARQLANEEIDKRLTDIQNQIQTLQNQLNALSGTGSG